ncbi:MAG: hypothetical protein WAL98_01580 [Desulfatiglandaceae bacterium]|jgi:hypothetical protein
MDLKDTFRLRVETCIGTIIDVHKIFGAEHDQKTFLNQFDELKRNLQTLDMGAVSEGDILMVEKATNALLKEFRSFYERRDLGSVYNEMKS